MIMQHWGKAGIKIRMERLEKNKAALEEEIRELEKDIEAIGAEKAKWKIVLKAKENGETPEEIQISLELFDQLRKDEFERRDLEG